jgi:hypothetical protein
VPIYSIGSAAQTVHSGASTARAIAHRRAPATIDGGANVAFLTPGPDGGKGILRHGHC